MSKRNDAKATEKQAVQLADLPAAQQAGEVKGGRDNQTVTSTSSVRRKDS